MPLLFRLASGVTRSISKRDRRAREVTLSAEGENIYAKALPVVVALQNEILRGLSSSEREAFLEFATKTIEANSDEKQANNPACGEFQLNSPSASIRNTSKGDHHSRVKTAYQVKLGFRPVNRQIRPD